jgi:hypothetical protein
MGKLIALQPCANCGRPAPAHVMPDVCERCLTISQSWLDVRVADLVHNCGDRVQLLTALPVVVERLAEIVPPHRRDELSHSLFYIRNELDLTQETLLIVLTCLMVLHERYTAESA